MEHIVTQKWKKSEISAFMTSQNSIERITSFDLKLVFSPRRLLIGNPSQFSSIFFIFIAFLPLDSRIHAQWINTNKFFISMPAIRRYIISMWLVLVEWRDVVNCFVFQFIWLISHRLARISNSKHHMVQSALFHIFNERLSRRLERLKNYNLIIVNFYQRCSLSLVQSSCYYLNDWTLLTQVSRNIEKFHFHFGSRSPIKNVSSKMIVNTWK